MDAFWTITLPNYLAATASIAGTVLAIISLYVARESKAESGEAKAEIGATTAAVADGFEILSKPRLVRTEGGAPLGGEDRITVDGKIGSKGKSPTVKAPTTTAQLTPEQQKELSRLMGTLRDIRSTGEAGRRLIG